MIYQFTPRKTVSDLDLAGAVLLIASLVFLVSPRVLAWAAYLVTM